jgi:hypothetical protein
MFNGVGGSLTVTLRDNDTNPLWAAGESDASAVPADPATPATAPAPTAAAPSITARRP